MNAITHVANEKLVKAESQIKDALIAFAGALTGMEKADQPAALDVITQMKKVTEEVYDRLRSRCLDQAILDGHKVTEKGTYEASYNGFTVRAIPTRTGTDPKKLEAKLRALKLEPSAWMDTTLVYKVNDAKLMPLIEDGRLKLEEVAYDKSYRVELERA